MISNYEMTQQVKREIKDEKIFNEMDYFKDSDSESEEELNPKKIKLI